jgi:MOSC domain-containing protein YiiM
MKILSVNIAQPEDHEFEGQTVRTSIFKKPVTGSVAVGETHLEGDGQANLQVHGGIHKAVYVYSHDHYSWWAEKLQRDDLEFGQFGENLTVSGLDDEKICIGDQLKIGNTLMAVTGPRIPCTKLGIKFGDKTLPRKFTEAARPGFYLRVITCGNLSVGDSIEPGKPGRGNLTVADLFRAISNPRSEQAISRLRLALTLPDLDPAFIPNINKRLVALERK